MRYFLSAAACLCLTATLLAQNSGQKTQPPPVKVVAEGYHIVHPESEGLRPTTPATAQNTSKAPTKKKSAKRKY